jgi:hypothetical protein
MVRVVFSYIMTHTRAMVRFYLQSETTVTLALRTLQTCIPVVVGHLYAGVAEFYCHIE